VARPPLPSQRARSWRGSRPRSLLWRPSPPWLRRQGWQMKSANQSWICQTAKRSGCLAELLVGHRFSGCGRPECRQPDRKNCARQGLSAIAGPALQHPPGSNAPPAQSGASPAPACCGGCGWRAAASPHRPDPTALEGSVMACSSYLTDLTMPSKTGWAGTRVGCYSRLIQARSR